MDIKVSVVMAVYNSEKYIRQAVDSLIYQTLKEIEIILVDDGSKDSSLSILSEYAQNDNRIHVLENKEDSDGAAMARNLGVSAAKGEYLSVVDADDFFEPDMLEKAYQKAKQETAEVVIFDGFRFDDTNQVDLCRNTILCHDMLPEGFNGSYLAPQDNAEDLFRMTLGAAWNTLIALEHVRKHDLRFASFHHADDLEFVYLAFALSKRIAVLPERLIHYRVNINTSQAARVTEWPDTAWKAMLSFRKKLEDKGLFETYRTAFIRVAMKYQLFYLNSMKDCGSFIRLYRDLKDGKLKALGIADATEEELHDEGFIEQRRLILSYEPEEYLFRKMNGMPPFDEAKAWKNGLPRGSRLVVYGADRLGVDVVHSILWNQDYKLTAWVDEQYESLGYPVQSPDMIKGMEYDYILIVSRSKENYERIRSMLEGRGIVTEKLRWQKNE